MDDSLCLKRDGRVAEVKRYSSKTRKDYLQHIRAFLAYSKVPVEMVSFREIDLFLLHLIEDRHVSESTQNVAISAIKFFYRYVLHKDVSVKHLRRPKRRKPLPDVLARSELKATFGGVENVKHRTMLVVAYSCGLRVGCFLS